MKTVATLYGDSTKATFDAAEALSRNGIPFRVTLTHNVLITPTLGTPLGEVRGLENIRDFAEHAEKALTT